MSVVRYKVHYIDVGDADAIVISYQRYAQKEYIVLIDAGNICDSEKIKSFLWENYQTTKIDLAICTHPDRDHKGGFFGLLSDKYFKVNEFWYLDPCNVMYESDFLRMSNRENMIKRCMRVYAHPYNSSLNLLTLANRKCSKVVNVHEGIQHDSIPIEVIGPSEKYYRQAALGMVQNFAELTSEPDLEKYDEAAEVSDEEASRSIMNASVDESYTNMASMILLFAPDDETKFLMTGDAAQSSIYDSFKRHGKQMRNCILKVPHHGSKHNLTTDLIRMLNPRIAVVRFDSIMQRKLLGY